MAGEGGTGGCMDGRTAWLRDSGALEIRRLTTAIKTG